MIIPASRFKTPNSIINRVKIYFLRQDVLYGNNNTRQVNQLKTALSFRDQE